MIQLQWCSKIGRDIFQESMRLLLLLQPFLCLWILFGTTWMSRYQKGKTEKPKPMWISWSKREWQWYQLCHIQIYTLPQTDNHANTPPLIFYRPDALPATHPTVTKYWRHRKDENRWKNGLQSHDKPKKCGMRLWKNDYRTWQVDKDDSVGHGKWRKN